MENYRLKEILELTKANLIKNTWYSQYGICKELREVFFPVIDIFAIEQNSNDIRDYKFVIHYLEENKPTPNNQYAEFTNNIYWTVNSRYWWKTIDNFPETKEIRIDYLTALINNIK